MLARMLTASDTAYSIAAIRAMEGELPEAERLFNDPYARIFAAAGEHAAEGTQRFLSLPFFRDGIRLRTRAIDDFVRQSLDQGLTQFVVLGAGFDARALRMPEITRHNASVFEVDLPAVLEKKRAILDSAGHNAKKHVAAVPCDFSADFEDILAKDLERHGFRSGAGAIFVMEGVVAYIDTNAADRTLRFMARTGGAGSRLVFDFGPGIFGSKDAREHVLGAGFTTFEEVGYDTLWRRYMPGEPHANASFPRLGYASVGLRAAQ